MKSFTLSSGAVLSYSEFGDSSSSRVVLYGHGFPGTGEEAGIAHRAAIEQGIRIISPTRPGIGESTFDPNRTILQWPETINELLKSLGVDRLSLLGVSGGTPYTLAFLRHFPERIDRCVIVSGMGPPESVVLDGSMSIFSKAPIWCAYNLPWVGKVLISLIATVSRFSPHLLLACYRLCMASDDRRLLNMQGNARRMLDNFRIALAQGSSGVYHDFKLLMAPWGFTLQEIKEPVSFLHGDNDKLVPLSIARANKRQIPGSSLTEFPDRGHFMAFEITKEIIAHFKASATP